ncbi:MAG: hypothetical protein AB7S94_04590 [Simkaniaceae bacterium]
MELEGITIENNSKQSQQNEQIGETLCDILNTAYHKLEKELKKQNSHKSFWDKLGDFFKDLAKVLADLTPIGLALNGGNTLSDISSFAKDCKGIVDFTLCPYP